MKVNGPERWKWTVQNMKKRSLFHPHPYRDHILSSPIPNVYPYPKFTVILLKNADYIKNVDQVLKNEDRLK